MPPIHTTPTNPKTTMITTHTTSPITHTTRDSEEADSTIIEATTIGSEEETEEATGDPRDVVINHTRRRDLLLHPFVENPGASFVRRKAAGQRITAKKIRKLRRTGLGGGTRTLTATPTLLLLILKAPTRTTKITLLLSP